MVRNGLESAQSRLAPPAELRAFKSITFHLYYPVGRKNERNHIAHVTSHSRCSEDSLAGDNLGRAGILLRADSSSMIIQKKVKSLLI